MVDLDFPNANTRATALADVRLALACRGMKILNGRDPRSGRVLALTGHRGFLLWRTQSGTPVWTMGFEPVLFRWRPLRLARVRCERESVCVVRPLVLHPHRRYYMV